MVAKRQVILLLCRLKHSSWRQFKRWRRRRGGFQFGSLFPFHTKQISQIGRKERVEVCVTTARDLMLLWTRQRAAPGELIRCRFWPSLCDNVVMWRDSWQLCFLSAQIFWDINTKCHSGAVSTAAQQTHDSILMCTLIPLPFFPSFPLPPSFHLPNLSWFSLLSTLHHCLCFHLYVLLCILIFSSHTNVFALVFSLIFRCLCVLNEA